MTASEAPKVSIPVELLDDGKARLFRVDVHSHDLEPASTWAEQLKYSGVITRLLYDAWLEPRILCDEYRASNEHLVYWGAYANLSVQANGAYDGIAVGFQPASLIPAIPETPLFHIVKTEVKDLVCKFAILGPALFHPTRVSSNVPNNIPLPNKTKNKLVAYFI